MPSQTDVLEITETDGVARLTLARPEILNALNRELIRALRDYFSELYYRRDIRVVVVSGQGRAFCARFDLKERQQKPSSARVGGALEGQRQVRDIMVAMRRCPQPIISIVQGAASGGSFAIALASDIRLLTPRVWMRWWPSKIAIRSCVSRTPISRRESMRFWTSVNRITRRKPERTMSTRKRLHTTTRSTLADS